MLLAARKRGQLSSVQASVFAASVLGPSVLDVDAARKRGQLSSLQASVLAASVLGASVLGALVIGRLGIPRHSSLQASVLAASAPRSSVPVLLATESASLFLYADPYGGPPPPFPELPCAQG